MTASLLPCPLCGGLASDTSYRSCDCCGKAFNGRVSCLNSVCGCEVSHFDTVAEAVAAWNRREVIARPDLDSGTPLDELQTLGQQYDQPTTFTRFLTQEEILAPLEAWIDDCADQGAFGGRP